MENRNQLLVRLTTQNLDGTSAAARRAALSVYND